MTASDQSAGVFKLPPLPFGKDALEPVISARTLEFHHGKHHKGYVDKLNELVKGTPFAELTLEEIIAETSGDEDNRKIFNNAAQVWNHTFYWQCLSPHKTEPSKDLSDALATAFGSREAFDKQFIAAAVDRFGSGWAWLVAEGGKLKIKDTVNADTPIASGTTCLLTVDVWEHAYYLDYQNLRKDHVEAVVARLLNWDFASAAFAEMK